MLIFESNRKRRGKIRRDTCMVFLRSLESMETGQISQEINDTIIPALQYVDIAINNALESQISLKSKLERLLAELQVMSSMMQQIPLEQAIVRCVIARKRILNVQRKLSTIENRIQRIQS